MAAVVPEQIADENNREVYAGKRRGPAGTDDAHGGSAPFAVNENPVKERVDDVCGDQREGDRQDQVHGLDAAADSEIEEQGKESEGQRFHIGNGKGGDGGINMKAAEERAEKPEGHHEQRRHSDGEVDAVDERAVTVFALACSESLGDQGIETDQKSAAEEGNDVEEVGTDADGADGAGALRKMADHDGIDDAHGHPADLGKDEREGEAHSWAQLAAKCSEADLGSVSGADSERKLASCADCRWRQGGPSWPASNGHLLLVRRRAEVPLTMGNGDRKLPIRSELVLGGLRTESGKDQEPIVSLLN